jgi:hypothetical protein
MSTLVTIQSGAFRFCRYGSAALLWWSFFSRRPEPLAVALAVWLISLVAGVHRSPMILLWSASLGRLPGLRGADRNLDLVAMRIAHGLASLLGAIVLGLWIWVPTFASPALLLFALIKTASAAGLCPAEKLARCLGGKGCCALGGGKRNA